MNSIIIAFIISLFGTIPLDFSIFQKSLFLYVKQWIKNIFSFGLIVGFVLSYIYMPPLLFPDILIPLSIMLVVNVFFSISSIRPSSLFGSHNQIKKLKIPFVVLFIIVSIAILSPLYPYTQANQLHELPTVIQNATSIGTIDVQHIRQVPIEFAQWKADKVLGDLGTRVRVGDLAIQIIDDHLYWIAPLEFRSFWKWFKFQNTPGYVIVDAEQPEIEPQLIADHKFQFLQSAFFQTYLHRHIYQQYPHYRLKEFTLEIRDDGKPFWVVSALVPTILFHGETGETSFYDQPPLWVDRVYPEYLAEQYNYWYGAYVHGFLNTLFSQRDMHVPTSLNGIIDVFAVQADDELVWFTGHTSPSLSDQSLTGYSTLSTRTGAFIYYHNISGYYNEEAAVSNANSEVANFAGYHGTQPLFYMIFDEPTWFVPIVSSHNKLQKIVLVHAKTGYSELQDTLAVAVSAYQQWIYSKKSVNISETSFTYVNGTILRINNGYILFEHDDTMYYVEGARAALSREGDEIILKINPYQNNSNVVSGEIIENKDLEFYFNEDIK